jgi:phosphomevalonate kinase
MVLGEYAVLDGAECLVWAVDRRVEVRATGLASGLEVVAPGVGVEDARAEMDGEGRVRWLDTSVRGPMRMVSAAVAAVANHLASHGAALPGARLHIDTAGLLAPEIGDKLGLGSSAAVVAATSAALLVLAGQEPGDACRRHVFDCAARAHNAAQGKVGSGADIAASTFGGALRYRAGVAPGASLRVPDGLHWWAVWSGRPASTPAMVAQVRELARTAPSTYDGLITELSITSARGCDAFVAGEVVDLLAAIEAYDNGLARLGAAAGVDIVSIDHQRIGDVVRAEGGVYKPSGAGGGDLGMAFSADERTHMAVGAALARAGWTTVPLAADTYGLRWQT